MIWEVIKPHCTNFTINIPTNYIDREIEFIMFPLDEPEIVDKVKKQDISVLGGSLNKYSNRSKIDLEGKAWELHIKDKYKWFS